mmetsp:Transcript_5110/g.14579  ORF Transcript_5110/g.14579 Transcript_5110/m.14579 type:complete len:277 (+) Transcript_5110:160-990(+)
MDPPGAFADAHVASDVPQEVAAADSFWNSQVGGACGSDWSGTVLAVNIGGRLFRTTSKTLRAAPFFDSMLRHIEGGHLGMTMDEDGNLFVDRSGELFVHVLEYLRMGRWLLGDRGTDFEFVEALCREAEFYGLDGESQLPLPRLSEYVTVWQFRDDMVLYVDCSEQTLREDADHQGLFRLCKYSGGLPLDQQTGTKRFKATSHSVQAVIAYFALRGFKLQHVLDNSMITHTTSADGQSRTGSGLQYLLSRVTTVRAGSSCGSPVAAFKWQHCAKEF